ncbi:MAG: LemA protein [Kiritimatiellia bacterium]|jgi:LemA protein
MINILGLGAIGGGLLVLVGLGVVLGLFSISLYNKLVRSRNQVKNGFAQIDVQLKRRYNLIPNLVETAKEYMSYEKETLEAVIQARNSAMQAVEKTEGNPADAESMKSLVAADQALTGSLGKLFALSEAYPDLKANQNMMQLSEELTSTENKVAFARQAYNDAVMKFNTAIESFPANFFAGGFGFKPSELFEVEAEYQRDAPEVKF